ncbi:glycosyltransferase family 4 protein [Paenibacillus chondroitinus]|uniref:Glycosyltransferase family 4 protein n=1 Tax=Paenibacillus chondroitinus TaxID=59842 RepID=A0ABU6D416_9BACL|nr:MULTISPECIES: glycosyltransferase family 4 protein [Paenibacillus]MCY9660740.1 hypothetical protein [Paenibacillus anseongense]MEB4792462.1 glycosyltransferase family 4 protein [Paenibacillus chondroitinus]
MRQSKIWCAVSSFLVADGRFASYNKYGLRIQARISKQARDDAVKQFRWQATAQSLADFYRLKQEERHEKNFKETDEG